MRKFKFSLEALLKIKMSLEKQLKNKLAEARNHLNNCISELERIVRLKEELRHDFMNSLQITSSHDLKAFNLYYRKIEEKRINQLMTVEEARKEFLKIQKQLMEVMTERKMYEKLKEKEYDEYLFEVNREIEKEIDDIVSYKITKPGR